MTFLKNLFAHILFFFGFIRIEKQLPDLEKELEARTIIHKLAEQMNPDDEYWESRWIPDPKPNGIGTYSIPSIDMKDPTELIILCYYGERVPPRFKLSNGKRIHRIWRAHGNKHMQVIDKTEKARMFIWKENLKNTSKQKRKEKREAAKQARQT